MLVVTPEGGMLYGAGDRKNPRRVLVRARDRRALEEMVRFDADRHHAILHTPEADFPYRATVPRALWARYCAYLAHRTTYPSFKGACLTQDPTLYRFVVRCWEASFGLQ